jgi:signal transduction histidine kinase
MSHVDVEGPVHFIAAISNLTEFKQLEQKHIEAAEGRVADAEQARTAAEETRRMQELNIDVSSHELRCAPTMPNRPFQLTRLPRNPLSGLTQAAELISSSLGVIHEQLGGIGSDPAQLTGDALASITGEIDESIESIGDVLSCCTHLERITREILSFSKANMNLLALTTLDFDLVGFVRTTMRVFSSEARQHAVELSLDIDESIYTERATWIHADPHRLRQSLLNLVSNALRNLVGREQRRIVVRPRAWRGVRPPDPETMRIETDEVKTHAEMLWVSFDVEDNGRGLDKEEQSKLFRRFAQAHPQTDSLVGRTPLWPSVPKS